MQRFVNKQNEYPFTLIIEKVVAMEKDGLKPSLVVIGQKEWKEMREDRVFSEEFVKPDETLLVANVNGCDVNIIVTKMDSYLKVYTEGDKT